MLEVHSLTKLMFVVYKQAPPLNSVPFRSQHYIGTHPRRVNTGLGGEDLRAGTLLASFPGFTRALVLRPIRNPMN